LSQPVEKVLPFFRTAISFGRTRRVLLGWPGKTLKCQPFREFTFRKGYAAPRRRAAVFLSSLSKNMFFRQTQTTKGCLSRKPEALPKKSFVTLNACFGLLCQRKRSYQW